MVGEGKAVIPHLAGDKNLKGDNSCSSRNSSTLLVAWLQSRALRVILLFSFRVTRYISQLSSHGVGPSGASAFMPWLVFLCIYRSTRLSSLGDILFKGVTCYVADCIVFVTSPACLSNAGLELHQQTQLASDRRR